MHVTAQNTSEGYGVIVDALKGARETLNEKPGSLNVSVF